MNFSYYFRNFWVLLNGFYSVRYVRNKEENYSKVIGLFCEPVKLSQVYAIIYKYFILSPL